MNYAIIGSGKIGSALARAFARKNIEVAIANSRGPETLTSLTEELGASVFPQSVQDACEAEMIFLAVPFRAHNDFAKQFKPKNILPDFIPPMPWNGKIMVDVTNAFHVAPKELGGRLSSEVVGHAFVGARLVKAFNHLPAAQLGTNPSVEGRSKSCSYRAMTPMPAPALPPWSPSLASFPSSSGSSLKAAQPCTFWTGSLAGFSFRTW
jgi:8-hydroxy-5-deazaflavin:NADPH oxidoreductase